MGHQGHGNKVLLYIRRTRNYFHTREVDVNDNGVIENNHIRDIRDRLDMWPEATGKQFKRIRAQIARVAYHHNVRCRPDLIYNFSYRHLPKDEKLWVYPVDEDDLIDVTSLKAIRSISCGATSIAWRTTVAEYDKVRLSGSENVPSNCYALKTSAHPNFDLIDKHMFFQKTEFKDALRPGFISGMRVETPASVGRHWTVPSVEELVSRIRQFKAIDLGSVPEAFREPFSRIQDVFTVR